MNNKIQSCYLSTCICIFKKKKEDQTMNYDYETSDCTILVAVMFLQSAGPRKFHGALYPTFSTCRYKT